MRWISLGVAAASAAAVVPATVYLLHRAGLVASNYRGMRVVVCGGICLVAATAVSVGFLAVVAKLAQVAVFWPQSGGVFVYVFGVCALGVIDDLLEDVSPKAMRAGRGRVRGFRGHARAVVEGRPSTGAVKAAGSLALAVFVLSGSGRTPAQLILSALVLTLVTNLFNLLDVRPGRAVKALFALVCAVLALSRRLEPVWVLAPVWLALFAWLPFDLRERAMLGDAGAAVVGALGGLWCVLALGVAGQIVCALLVGAVTAYAEFGSLSVAIDKTPLLRRLDSLGRARHA